MSVRGRLVLDRFIGFVLFSSWSCCGVCSESNKYSAQGNTSSRLSQRLFLTFLIAETLPEHIRAQSVQIIFSTFKTAGVDISLQVVLISQNDSSGAAAVQQRSCVQSPKLHSSVSGGCNLLHPQEVINP